MTSTSKISQIRGSRPLLTLAGLLATGLAACGSPAKYVAPDGGSAGIGGPATGGASGHPDAGADTAPGTGGISASGSGGRGAGSGGATGGSDGDGVGGKASASGGITGTGSGGAGTASGGTGGGAATAGAPGMGGGGVASTGGVPGRAGGPAVGGRIGTGGVLGTGGIVGTGGVSPSGGAGGSVASCQVNATQCSMNGLQTCGTNGQWGTAVACGPHQACGGAVGSAKCTCNVDPVCKGVGMTCASLTMQATCKQDAQSCYYAESTSNCPTGTCSGAAGSATCSCASTCTVGKTCATSTSLGSCDSGSNGCNVQSTTACGGGLVCERLAPASCADPQWAEWPVPPSTSPGYTDNGDGTVTDSTTRLMWERTGTTTTMTQPAAVTYCATMARTGGHSDWRLPSQIELLSIVDYGRSGPSINPVFTGTTLTYYWSSTPYTGNTSSAWNVNFNDGITTAMAGMSSVRCVR